MNDFEAFFNDRKEQDLDKWSNYFEFYERYFSKFRGKPVRMMEIGVAKGGSMKMWRHYFGEDAIIIGVDINPECRQFESGNTHIEIGSQEDPVFLKSLKKKYPPFDIILDDGGHTMKQQIVSFEHLYDHVKDGGIYMVEDCCTSYWPAFGGGLKNPCSFIEYAKDLVDKVNAFFYSACTGEKFPASLTCKIRGLHFHTGMVVLEKGENPEPVTKISGSAAADSKNNSALIDASHAFIDNAPQWRVLLWKLKELFYAMTGQQEKKYLYQYQLKRYCHVKKAKKNGVSD